MNSWTNTLLRPLLANVPQLTREVFGNIPGWSKLLFYFLAFFALVTGCTLLYLELQEYGKYPWWDTRGVRTSQVAPSDSGFASAYSLDHLG